MLILSTEHTTITSTGKTVHCPATFTNFLFHSSNPAYQQSRKQSRKDWLKEEFENIREHLYDVMEELGYTRPEGEGWQFSTKHVEVGDTVHFPWLVFCKDRNMIVMGEHDWMPGRAEDILNKYRWGVVIYKDHCGRLYILPTYTFSHSLLSDKRAETVKDAITGKVRPFFADFMHVVVDDDGTVAEEPLCFENGMQLHCRSVNGFTSSKKGSFLSIHEECIHENGTPFQIRAKVVSKEDIAKLRKVVEASKDRRIAALQRAEANWPGTEIGSAATVLSSTPATPSKSNQDQSLPRSTSTQEKLSLPPNFQAKLNQPLPTSQVPSTEPTTVMVPLEVDEEAISNVNPSNNPAQTGTSTHHNGPTAMMQGLNMLTATTGRHDRPQLRDAPPLGSHTHNSTIPAFATAAQGHKRGGGDPDDEGNPKKRRRPKYHDRQNRRDVRSFDLEIQQNQHRR